ncbi:MAG: hypothetical protein JRD94_11295 [Deltaproteobacteria bacterium]|nr:hypothetical protein [Deltaproteobacteria bacterium]
MQNNQEKLGWRLLETLYDVGRADDAQGLVDEARCRLTMQGLVLAVSLHGAQRLAPLSAAA